MLHGTIILLFCLGFPRFRPLKLRGGVSGSKALPPLRSLKLFYQSSTYQACVLNQTFHTYFSKICLRNRNFDQFTEIAKYKVAKIFFLFFV